MRTLLTTVFVFALAGGASADPLIITVSDRDADGVKFERNNHRMTVHMIHSPDRERRLIEFLKIQDLLESRPWRLWNQDRKEGDAVVYSIFVTGNPGYRSLRLIVDAEDEKVFEADGLASFNGMQALAGEQFQLKSLSPRIQYVPRPRRR